jgi:hypothetical protein
MESDSHEDLGQTVEDGPAIITISGGDTAAARKAARSSRKRTKTGCLSKSTFHWVLC